MKAEYQAKASYNGLYLQQEEYLSKIAELNKMHEQMGMPKIRTEIRYAKATEESGIPNLQVRLESPEQEQQPNRPAKSKKKKKAKSQPSTGASTKQISESQVVAQTS